jgi:signal transduction histidine kinase
MRLARSAMAPADCHVIGVDAEKFELELRFRRPDGSVDQLRILVRAAGDHAGSPQYTALVSDVRTFRQADAASVVTRPVLPDMSSLMAFAASVAHEISQPLSGIVTNANACARMLVADPPNIAGAREAARRAIRDGHRTSDVLARLRALFSQSGQAGDLVDLNESAREVVARLSGTLHGHGVSVSLYLADDLPPVAGDRIQLELVMLNLLQNAVDAIASRTGGSRHVTIETASEDGDRVRVTVRDTGPGLPLVDTDNIFEPFFSTKTHGMGIGLFVSRSIIERHHGRLWAAPNDGPGATFSFCIPRSIGVPPIPSSDGSGSARLFPCA